ncbi:LLM class flavin-dependent oxidoreductase [Yinghuangia sp. ASG 101]|uniref:LLM class flavin-dependent oxidoreductase n=1 Tax=Yinghuangia sp. ASG 101 TaxID=2896848 RepID=UPI001E5EC0E8|nr:LLM class flavin-dependent oxidoreductase [Yinghuangia sp. ASG 101]UGQ14131.1 LLM class flavin-dependent oxidoreductase [Yinghuangia sp. ASG 101]
MPTILRFNQVTPGLDRAEVAARYQATIEMAAFADKNGFDMISLEEHHGADNGWSPAPLATAGAVFGATRQIGVVIAALLAPLYNPIRLAEDIAVLDNISGGRLSIVAGLGYRPEEYAAIGADWKLRGRLQDEAVDTLLKAWTGEPFTYRGETVRVTPRPFTDPHPVLMIGGTAKATVRRAVRFRLPFFAAAPLPELERHYYESAAEAGFDDGFVLMPSGGAGAMIFCTEDPDRAWAEYGTHFLHEAATYAAWQTPDVHSAMSSAARTVADLRAEGIYKCLTPDECVAIARSGGLATSLNLHPLCGGLPIDAGWSSVQLFNDKVMPRLRAA